MKDSRTSDAVVARLEDAIASGALPDAQMLPAERELMEQFGTSRTVIREAISTLANRGLLETRPRHRPVVRRAGFDSVLKSAGPVVQQLLQSPLGVKNLYDTRLFVEKGLVRNAALNADRTGIRALKEALSENEAAIDTAQRFYETDVAFHAVFYTIAANPVLSAINQGFVSWLAPQWSKMERSPKRNLVNFKAHQAIYLAILERDPDLAEQALESHLAEAWKYVESTFDDN